MAIDTLFDHASKVMTVISFLTFAGILWWALVRHREDDFAAAAYLPFADDAADAADLAYVARMDSDAANKEAGHV